ncbi:MFS transporter [Yinghuangia aomiensis]
MRRRLDPLGALTLGGGIGTLTAALVQGRQGWTQTGVFVLLGTAAVLLAAYAATALRGREPMLDLRLLRRPRFALSIFGSVVTGIAVISLASYLPTLFQGVLGLSPLQSAALLATWSGTSVAAAVLIGRFSAGVRAQRQVALGLAVIAIGFLALYGMGPHTSWTRVVPGLFVAGIGLGFLNASGTRLAVESVPADRAAMGAGAANAARYTGASLGGALVVAVVQSAGAAPRRRARRGRRPGDPRRRRPHPRRRRHHLRRPRRTRAHPRRRGPRPAPALIRTGRTPPRPVPRPARPGHAPGRGGRPHAAEPPHARDLRRTPASPHRDTGR